MASVLNSRFVIDGEVKESTPAELLAEVCAQKVREDIPSGDEIVDESPDASPVPVKTDCALAEKYSSVLEDAVQDVPMSYPASYTLFDISSALIDSLWRQGNVSLEEIQLTGKWFWRSGVLGNMAALYTSIETASRFIDDLGVSLRRYSVEECGHTGLSFATQFSGAARIVPDKMVPDPSGWIVFVPFDNAEFRLGGSALAEALGCGGVSPKLGDADYFQDCFELVREFAVDGILLSACTVGRGGLRKTLESYAGAGASLELSCVLRAYPDCTAVEILFSEVPGVLIQIRNEDYDYLDAEFLLQDVAWYPLGHPAAGKLNIDCSSGNGIHTILESLIRNAEGED